MYAFRSRSGARSFTLGLVAALIALSTSLTFTPANAADLPMNKRCKSPALAAGLEWGNPDPLYLQLRTNVRWQNCRGILRKVVVETRWMDYSGALHDSELNTFTPDVTQFRNSSEGKASDIGLELPAVLGVEFDGEFVSYGRQGTHVLQSCNRDQGGRSRSGLNGDTFYAVVTGYNKAGKQILQLVTPPVVCGQNG